MLETGGRNASRGPVDRLSMGGAWLFLLLVAGNLVSTLLECGVGPCADNPTNYIWLPG
jgi:hypothetical protein